MGSIKHRKPNSTPASRNVVSETSAAVLKLVEPNDEDVIRAIIGIVIREKSIALYKAYMEALKAREKADNDLHKFIEENPSAKTYIEHYEKLQQTEKGK